MESEFDKALRLACELLPQAQADALRLAVKAETDNFNAVLERTWASQRDLASSRDAALAALAESEARRSEAERERDAFAETYRAVNEVLLSGSTQRVDPTAERVQSNLTRLMERAERAEREGMGAYAAGFNDGVARAPGEARLRAALDSAERSLAAAVEVLRAVNEATGDGCPLCPGFEGRITGRHAPSCALAAVISGGGR